MKPKLYGLGTILVLLLVLEFFMLHPHPPGNWFHDSRGLNIALGVLGGIVMMFFAKGLGEFWLYRKEDYYKKGNRQENESERKTLGQPPTERASQYAARKAPCAVHASV